MVETLEQSEIDALLSAVDEGDVPHADTTAKQIFSRARHDRESVEIREYDFKRPERISKDQMRALQTLHETFARNFGASVSGFLRTIVEVQVEDTEQMTYAEYTSALPNPTSFNLIESEQLDGSICLELSPLIVYPIIDRLLGGSSHQVFFPQRPMTIIETRLVARILDRATTALGEAWESVRPMQFKLGDMESNPQIVQIVAPNEVVVVVRFELKLTGKAGTMSLAIPFNVIEPLIDDLNAQSWSTGRHRDDHSWEEVVAGRIGEAQVDVSGVLAETTITMAELRHLEVGDLIVTETPATQPVSLVTEGVPKYLARIGQHRGARSLKILRAIAPGDRRRGGGPGV